MVRNVNNGMILLLLFCCFLANSQDNSNPRESDLYKALKYSYFSKMEIENCYRKGAFPRQRFKKSDSKLFVEIDSEISEIDGLIIKGKGYVATSMNKPEYPRWKEDFTVEILLDQRWEQWRKHQCTGCSVRGSKKKRIYKRPTVFNYEIQLNHANKGEIETQARVCFEYKKGKFLYSNPFDVKISEEQYDWIIEQNHGKQETSTNSSKGLNYALEDNLDLIRDNSNIDHLDDFGPIGFMNYFAWAGLDDAQVYTDSLTQIQRDRIEYAINNELNLNTQTSNDLDHGKECN